MSNRAASSFPVWGIDVSRHQTSFDAAQVAASGCRFVVLKATEGMTLVDPTFHYRVAECKKVGLPWGAYHFARPGDVATQVHHFVSTVLQAGEPVLPFVLDIEDVSISRPVDFIRAWLDVMATYHRRSMIYSYVAYVRPHAAVLAALGTEWWLAAYRAIEPDWPFDNVRLWQHTSSVTVPGIPERVDRNVWLGSREEFERWIAPQVQLRVVHDEEGNVKYQLVKRVGDPTVWVTDGVRLVKAVPSPHVRDILAFSLGPVREISDDEFWQFLAK
jgi:lysozyme